MVDFEYLLSLLELPGNPSEKQSTKGMVIRALERYAIYRFWEGVESSSAKLPGDVRASAKCNAHTALSEQIRLLQAVEKDLNAFYNKK